MKEEEVTHPIVTRDQEMVGPLAPVPVRVLAGDDGDIICHQTLESVPREVGHGLVHKPYHLGHTKGEEEGVRLLRVLGREGAFSGAVHLVDKLPLRRVYIVHRPVVH